MIKGKFQPAVIAALLLAASNANATLEARLNGQAYYDTETDLTWTAKMNPNGNQTLDKQLNFLSSFNIDGISEWRIPTWFELYDIVEKSSDCPWITYCIPTGPFSDFENWFWYLTDATEDKINYNHTYEYGHMYEHGPDGRHYLAYSPSMNDGYPSPLIDPTPFYFALGAWPVHTGDVAAISQVPELETYAMLLAGFGLLCFMARRRKVSAV